MKIVFTGDVFLGGDLLDKSAESIIASNTFNNADKIILNLEQPISDNEYVADKCTLYTGSSTIEKLRQLNIAAVNLAHNHIQDKGKEGIVETIEHLDVSNIGHFGAGKNIGKAKSPYWIDDKTCVLGYCEFGKTYLKQIQIATDVEPGVNPLRYESIMKDLDELPKGTKAILYFHWGREHVWLPPKSDIELARKILKDERVILIIGMHCHRIQGYIEHNNKRAYMSLGNFLFPNFFIKPPTQIAYPESIPKKVPITRQYHGVSQLTYKKWRLSNRVSLILEYDTITRNVNHIPVIQDDNDIRIMELHGLSRKIALLWIKFLCLIYRIPDRIYSILEKLSTFLTSKIWRFQITIFQIRQYGFISCMGKAFNCLEKAERTASEYLKLR